MKFKVILPDGTSKYELSEDDAIKLRIENPGSKMMVDDHMKRAIKVSKDLFTEESVKEYVDTLTPAQQNDVALGKKKIIHTKDGFSLGYVRKKEDEEIRISTEAAKKKRESEILGLLKSVLQTANEMGIHPDYTSEEIDIVIKKIFRK